MAESATSVLQLVQPREVRRRCSAIPPLTGLTGSTVLVTGIDPSKLVGRLPTASCHIGNEVRSRAHDARAVARKHSVTPKF
jgi:hypothetical protein